MEPETSGKPTVLRNAPVPETLEELVNMSIPEVGIQNLTSTEKRPPPEMDGGGNSAQGSVGGIVYGARQFLHYCWGAYDILSNVYFTKLNTIDDVLLSYLHTLRNRWDYYSILYKEPLEKISATEDNCYTLADTLFLNRCWIRAILLSPSVRNQNNEYKDAMGRFQRQLPEIYKQYLLQFDANQIPPAQYTVRQLVDSIDGIASRWCYLTDGPAVRAVLEQLLNRAAVVLTSIYSSTVFDVIYYRNEVKRENRRLVWYNANSDLITYFQARLDGMCYAIYSYSCFPRLTQKLPSPIPHDMYGCPLKKRGNNNNSNFTNTTPSPQPNSISEERRRARNRRRRRNRRALRASRAVGPVDAYHDPSPSTEAIGTTADLDYNRELEELFHETFDRPSESETSESETWETSEEEEDNEIDENEEEEEEKYGREKQILMNEYQLTKTGSWKRYRSWLKNLIQNMQGERGDGSLRIRCLECWVWPGERKLWERRNKGEICKKIEVVSSCISAPRVTTTQNMLRCLLSPTATEKGLLDEERGHDWGIPSAGTVWRDMVVLRAVCSYFRVRFRKSWGDHFLLLQEDFGRCINALGVSHNYPFLVQNGAGDAFDCWYQRQYIHSRCAEKAFFYWLYIIWRDFQGKAFCSMDLRDLLERIFGSPYYGAKKLEDMELDNSKVLWSGSPANNEKTFISAVF